MKIKEAFKEWPKVAIIVLNWNGWQDTIECLESVYQISYPDYEVILIDNGSKDQSLEKIKEYAIGNLEVNSEFMRYDGDNKPIKVIELTKEQSEKMKDLGDRKICPSNKKITIIKCSKNYGFAEGNNIGVRYSIAVLNPHYILLLNNDTVVDKDFLEYLVDALNKSNCAGIAGPKIYYYDFRGKKNIIHSSGGKLDMWRGLSWHLSRNKEDHGYYSEIASVDYITGACLLIKKEMIEKINLFNPMYFAYWEETDLCMRGLKNGYKTMYVPDSRIWHKVSASSSKFSLNYYYYSRNRFLFMREHATIAQFSIFLLYFLLLEFWLRFCIIAFRDKDLRSCKSFIKGVFDGLITIKR